MRRKSRTICGIYYLWDGAEIIYIGKSEDIRDRIWHHRGDKFDFAGYFIEECEPHELFEREAEAILKHKPRHNVANNLPL